MKGFVGIGRADHVETAITEATAGLKKADFLILIAPFSKIEAAAALLGEKYPGTPMIGTSGEGIAKEMRLTQAVMVIGFAGVEVCTGVIEDVRTTPVKSMHTFLSNLQAVEPGDSDTICLEFMTGCEERVLSTVHDSLQEAGVPLIGASAYGVLLGEKHCVILDGKVHTRSCAYAFIKNKGGKIHLYKENIYKRQSRRAHFANLVEPGTKTLFQLDGVPALELYQEETGVHLDAPLAMIPVSSRQCRSTGTASCSTARQSMKMTASISWMSMITGRFTKNCLPPYRHLRFHSCLALTVRTVCAYLQRTMP